MKNTLKEMIRKLMSWEIRKIHVVITLLSMMICFVICGTLSLIYISSKTDGATVVMTLNYENSSSGLNPDNSKFNLRFLKGEEVLGTALVNAQMNEFMTTTELASYISIKGVSSKPIDVNSEMKYIDSTYKISLTLPKRHTENISAEKMLAEVCESYKEWFISSYVVDSKALEIDVTNFDNMEYTTISSYFDLMALRGKNYLSRKEESTTAFTGTDGTTWKSLRQELSNLTDYDIATFNQYIWENGIAKDKTWEITVISHLNDDLQVDYELFVNNADKYSIVVDQYRNEMTSSILIPTYDEDGQFYMSRTKTGIDDLSKSMSQYLSDATSIKEKMDLNEDKIDKLKKSKVNSTEKADMMLDDIKTKIIDIFERIKELDAEYVNQKTEGYVQYEFVEKKLSIPFL